MEKADNSIGFKVHELYKIFKQNVKDEMNKMGINPTYRYIFMCINCSKTGVTQRQICDLIHLKAPSVSLILQEMENEELILRVKDEKDNRKTIVTLTEKGKKLDNKLRQVFETVEFKFQNVLSKEELELLISLIDKMKDGLKEVNLNV